MVLWARVPASAPQRFMWVYCRLIHIAPLLCLVDGPVLERVMGRSPDGAADSRVAITAPQGSRRKGKERLLAGPFMIRGPTPGRRHVVLWPSAMLAKSLMHNVRI